MNAVGRSGSLVAFRALLFAGVAPFPRNAQKILPARIGTQGGGRAKRNSLDLLRTVPLFPFEPTTVQTANRIEAGF